MATYLAGGYPVEISGNEYLAGAVPVRRASPAMKNALAAKKVQSGVLVKEEPPTRSYEYPVGFPVTSVTSTATAAITTRPQLVFRPERLVIDDAIAPQFQVNDLRVGKNSQFLNVNPIPGGIFRSTAVGVRLKCETAQINSDITINVTNNSLGTLNFSGALIGAAVE